MTLLRPTQNTITWPPKECEGDLSSQGWSVVAQITNLRLLDWQLPRGIATYVEPDEPLLVRTDFVRREVARTRVGAKTVLYPVQPATVAAHAGTLVARFLLFRSESIDSARFAGMKISRKLKRQMRYS